MSIKSYWNWWKFYNFSPTAFKKNVSNFFNTNYIISITTWTNLISHIMTPLTCKRSLKLLKKKILLHVSLFTFFFFLNQKTFCLFPGLSYILNSILSVVSVYFNGLFHLQYIPVTITVYVAGDGLVFRKFIWNHFRWWAWTLIKDLSPEEMIQVRAKVATLECLKGQRADLGLQRAWEGNYLVSV